MFIFAKMNNMEYEKKRAIILAVLGVIGVILVFSLRPKRERWIKETGIVWATEYHITYLSNKDLTDSINFAFRRVELSVSPFNKHSLVTAINEGKSDSLNPILIDLFYRSMDIHKATDGAFDPTISPLINAWGFGYEDGNLPNDKTIDSILSFTGLDKISINGNRIIRKDSRTSFNFSAIAKGYGCDEIARMFERNSVNNYLIEVGGEIVAKGVNENGEIWVVSIDKPIESADSIIHSTAIKLKTNNCGIATSGNYRNYRVDDNGNKYSHIINPATGKPEKSDILSATVVATDCATADAYATAFMVTGSEQAKQILAHSPELAVFFILSGDSLNFKYYMNESFHRLIAP